MSCRICPKSVKLERNAGVSIRYVSTIRVRVRIHHKMRHPSQDKLFAVLNLKSVAEQGRGGRTWIQKGSLGIKDCLQYKGVGRREKGVEMWVFRLLLVIVQVRGKWLCTFPFYFNVRNIDRVYFRLRLPRVSAPSLFFCHYFYAALAAPQLLQEAAEMTFFIVFFVVTLRV